MEINMTTNSIDGLLDSLVGKVVISARGRLLGRIRNIVFDTVYVSRRLFRFGPIVGEEVITTDSIDKITRKGVYLKPTTSEYWQMPIEIDGKQKVN